jgi:hypothetical protein
MGPLTMIVEACYAPPDFDAADASFDYADQATGSGSSAMTFAVGTRAPGLPAINWTTMAVPARLDGPVVALHAGRLNGDSATVDLTRLLIGARQSETVTIALSLRMTSPDESDMVEWRSTLCRQIAQGHIIITSRTDLDYLYPGIRPAEVAAFWRGTGAGCWIVTSEYGGALLIAPNGLAYRRSLPPAVSTTRAGADAFTNGILAGFAAIGAFGHDPTARLADIRSQQWLSILQKAETATRTR